MKVVLVALNAKYVHSNLAVHDLAAYAKEQLDNQFGEGALEIVIREYTINHNLDRILQSLYQEKAELYAFSCYIWNVAEILSVARQLSKVLPKARLWLGGPEVSYNSAQLLEAHPYIDGIMQGEGEAIFTLLVKTLYSTGSTDGVRPLLSATEGGQTPLSMDDIPFIYGNLTGFENKILYYETSRGCPFSCSYCLSSIDKHVRFRSLEKVFKELQFYLDHKVLQVKFIDRTFNCKREHSLAIWRYLLEHDNGVTNFHFEIAADLLGEEELALFEKMRPGLIQLEIGLQSTNGETLREIRRTMDIGKLKRNMERIQSFHNIHQHLDLIAGLPYEDFRRFQQSFNDAYEMKPNQLQLGFLKVLKGSYMQTQVAEYNLKYQDMQPYEVLSTAWISYDEILQLKQVEEMVEAYYNSDQFEHILPYLVSHWNSPFDFYDALGRFYESKGLSDVGLKRQARYEVLLSFCTENQSAYGLDLDIAKDLLTYDYYLRENAKSRPSWAVREPIEKMVYQAFFKKGGTDELILDYETYDSKQAARMMHIEPVSAKSMKWIMPGKLKNAEIYYIIYDYENRDALTKDASVHCLTHL